MVIGSANRGRTVSLPGKTIVSLADETIITNAPFPLSGALSRSPLLWAQTPVLLSGKRPFSRSMPAPPERERKVLGSDCHATNTSAAVNLGYLATLLFLRRRLFITQPMSLRRSRCFQVPSPLRESDRRKGDLSNHPATVSYARAETLSAPLPSALPQEMQE